ncbi:putative esterase of the alpha-beta hydrolase superfamily [Cylindrospermum stagnale PCC 7417]|uniref:Putative esterase of the alpha-beta hydrolase superfamily n=1 Tax=Cylindrospermum stagnale PCC 7417 TaxID=56107 RepID=K9WVC3_9NOST|nr:patatin-like phospholipase family protein [Cylindrospermum stagnale]AFZ24335.1 putative esterase of the alpha-beta hydrolase superfamily [Cylindrospermum stagnale PCC 7417]
MPKKLAVVISGAVSLGSYEAGVMYEVLEAIARHNGNAKSNEERIEIDVITGASAGGMTACILAQHLICGDQAPSDNPEQSLRQPYNNPLYNAWVKEVDIRELLQVEEKDQKYSLLQTAVVEEIGKKYLQDEPKMNQRHPAAASEIHVGIAMSNLSGFNFPISTDYTRSSKDQKEGTQQFSYTRYKDQFFCVAHRNESGDATLTEIDRKTIRDPETNQELIEWKKFRDKDTNWKELREVGLSSGAFPFAFRARKIQRFGGLGKRKHRDSEYLYTDGGVFENEPIGMAKILVDKIDHQYPSSKRYYLYIAPGQRKLPENPFTQKDDDLLVTGIALLNSIFHQSRFQDWVMEEMDAPVFSITASDFELIGDVFSAFGGFLEEKFRAYDYNIGRERAKFELSDPTAQSQLQDLIKNEVDNMPSIEWKVNCKIGSKDVKSWAEAKENLIQLAQPRSIKGELLQIDQLAKRDQFAELRELMKEVDVDTRDKIIQQLTLRLESLINLINDYLGSFDNNNDGSFLSKLGSRVKFNTRERIGKPLTKIVLTRALEFWLRRSILPQK